jgi:gluconolactonase
MSSRITPVAALVLILGCNTRTDDHQIGTFHAENERFWKVVPGEAVAENIGVGFQFTEGPAWHPDGILLFSDVPSNTIYRWNGRNFRAYRKPSNHSNGLLAEPDGSLLACEHGSRSVTRYSPGGGVTILADRYMGRRLNSPNDLCKASNGAIFFTDPPWGLPEGNADPAKELPFNGVYRLQRGALTLLDSTLTWPNGIALSPDEHYLYVADYETGTGNGEEQREVFWMRYSLDSKGGVVERSLFFRAPDPSLPGLPDGMTVDRKGNLFLTGPGGILVVDPEGEHLGTIGLPVTPANLAFGPRQRALYVTARSTIVRIRLQKRPN